MARGSWSDLSPEARRALRQGGGESQQWAREQTRKTAGEGAAQFFQTVAPGAVEAISPGAGAGIQIPGAAAPGAELTKVQKDAQAAGGVFNTVVNLTSALLPGIIEAAKAEKKRKDDEREAKRKRKRKRRGGKRGGKRRPAGPKDYPAAPPVAAADQPGPWSAAATWTDSSLQNLAHQASQAAGPVTANPQAHSTSVLTMMTALSTAKRSLDASTGPAMQAGGNVLAEHQRLSQRWYEAASGLYRYATQGGVPVGASTATSFGSAFGKSQRRTPVVHVLTVRGVSFTPGNIAFASAGGSAYAQALARDTQALSAKTGSGGGGGFGTMQVMGLAVVGVLAGVLAYPRLKGKGKKKGNAA